MIPYNGYFTTHSNSGGGFDDDGQPLEVTVSVAETFNCNVRTVSNNKMGTYEDGKFVKSSFEIFITLDKMFSATEIELFKNNVSVGKFPIQSIEHLQIVGRTKIIV